MGLYVSNRHYASGPNGLKNIINWGNKVRAAIRAITMARPVSRPKYIVGMKLERARIEKPITIVSDV